MCPLHGSKESYNPAAAVRGLPAVGTCRQNVNPMLITILAA